MKKNLKININDLTFKCIIGILDFERIKKQKVIININFEYEFSKNYFIDYSEVVDLIKKEMKKEQFKLLEDAIISLENTLNNKYTIKNLQITISKPEILNDCIVSLSNLS